MKLKSKAKTLKDLKLRHSRIPILKIFKCEDFINNRKRILNNISGTFKNHNVAIRSSFENEDTLSASNAGKFKSFLDINSSDKINLEKKIIGVINSKKKFTKHDEFFVQKMVSNVSLSGVILTRNLENYAKCININYSQGKKTNIVTSGKVGSKNLTYYENNKYPIPQKFKKLYESIKEIRKIFSNDDLDIEFAIDKKKNVFILQVRKLIVPKNENKNSYIHQNFFLKLEKKIIKLKKKHHDLIGDTTYFGVMPDWNPAEILGTKPRPLAISLYRELITDHIWSQNRESYGFKELSQFHLMTNFYGTPFVDVRIDFNSWIPRNLDKKIAKKIISYYLKKFNSNTSLHDKIEFKILFTCATFTTEKKINEKFKNVLNKKEIKIFYKELKKINYQAIKQQKEDLQKIKDLIEKQKIIEKSNLYEIDKIYWLIEDCKKYGTIAFAGLARCGFIAIELLNSIEEMELINEEEKLKFLANINTITSELKNDFKKLNKKKFLKKYGHLRPGTYDITSKNYREAYSSYFSKKTIQSIEKKFKEKIKINKIRISHSHLKIFKNNDLFNFITQSIKYREYAKFIFTKSTDLVFKNLIRFGKKYKISRNDLSFLKISKIMDMYFNLTNYETIENLKKHISENKKEFFYNKNIILPDVIRSGKDLYVQHKRFEKIRYISNKKTISKILEYKKSKLDNDYKGVVCIESADPGYDFLFNKKIRGLITKYGGLNSHMAIRCAELNLPALIGVGEKNYNEIIKHNMINIDCEKKKFELIN